MGNKYKILFVLFLSLKSSCAEYCESKESSCGEQPESPTFNNNNNKRYLFYDVNPPEGFNARRDVYMRMAILANKLAKSQQFANFKLVLPPWSNMVHWGYKEKPEYHPWGRFFDVQSMELFAPVIEIVKFYNFEFSIFDYAELPKTYKKFKFDEVYILQHFEDMFETGNFEERMEITSCQRRQDLLLHYYFYKNLTSDNVKCLSFHGPATKLIEIIANSDAKTLFFHHAEVALHEYFGNKLYWQCRRSMRFNSQLINIASEFRKNYLNSSDEDDNTILPVNWVDEKPHRNAKGGPYVAVHLRRRDFLRSRSDQLPSVDNIVKQIKKHTTSLSLRKVFIATDDDKSVYDTLKKRLGSIELFRYVPDQRVIDEFGDGGIAIIDQIICSNARFFVGTHESTFSFRIQEEREIKGFPVESTFNVLCKDDKKCEKPSVWKIVY